MRWTGLALAAPLAAALLAACGDARPSAASKPSNDGCSNCHGGPQSPAPPSALSGSAATTEVAVGAHQIHLRDTPVRAAIACSECHAVPAAVGSPGHIDPAPAEVTFGPLATHQGSATPATPTWSRSPDARCSGVYCHGATMKSPPAEGPVWTFAVEPDPGRPGVCGTCHGSPPSSPHPQGNTTCSDCHPGTVRLDGSIDVLGGLHIDGVVQIGGLGCTSCHGDPQNPAPAAPPVDTAGSSSMLDVTVGAHQLHLRDTPVRAAIACSECHVVPADVGDAGHIDASPAEVTFGPLATTNATPGWDRGSATCSGVYCHGATMTAPPLLDPTWTYAAEPDPGRPAVCAVCHGDPPPLPHAQVSACWNCHAETVRQDGTIDLQGGRHVDGTLQPSTLTCTTCHGTSNPAPPRSTAGLTATTAVEVGAHQIHLRDTPVRTAIACDECHVVPGAVYQAGHIDGVQATLTFGTLASASGASPSWDRGGATCSGVYCHGATLASAPAQGPTWTFAVEPDPGRPEVCGTCHGNPPALPHPQVSACWNCHGETVRQDGTIDLQGGRHIDGAVQPATVGCTTCHGSSNPAPPRSTAGLTATTAVEVGAHQIHLRDTPVRAAIACSECHVVPATVDAPGHVDAVRATVTFGPLATSKLATPSWDRAGPTCSGVYCHGATMKSPPAQGPTWTFAAEPDPGRPEVCATCHGWPPPAPHVQLTACSGCHPETVVADGTNRTIDLLGGKHVDGALQATVGGGCAGCHGYPPATGAHAVHFGLTGVADTGSYGDLTVLEDRYPTATPATAPPVYAFGCGHCHPLDEAKHLDGTLEVEVYDAAAPAGSLKARAAPAAAYSGGLDGTCSGVYCHSSGQETPSWVKPYGGPAILSPAWASGAPLGCGGCHDDPPRYPSGGAGAPDANTHIQFSDDTLPDGTTPAPVEFGHFVGLLGAWHGSYHGGWYAGMDAAPMTCQTCHDQTVDPASTGPSGFYWLDTTGDYQLPGGDPSRFSNGYWPNTQCATCHAVAGTAPPGTGRVLPLRHVNGARDVAFDRRTLLPVNVYPGAPTSGVTRPYWVRGLYYGPPASIPPGGFYEADTATYSLDLSGAGYDPATKTCSSVACHLGESQVTWGVTPVGWATCNNCHQY